MGCYINKGLIVKKTTALIVIASCISDASNTVRKGDIEYQVVRKDDLNILAEQTYEPIVIAKSRKIACRLYIKQNLACC